MSYMAVLLDVENGMFRRFLNGLSLAALLIALPIESIAKSLHSLGTFWRLGEKYELSVDTDSIRKIGANLQLNVHFVFERPQPRPDHHPYRELVFVHSVNCKARMYAVTKILFYTTSSDLESMPESVLEKEPGWIVPDKASGPDQIVGYVCSR